MIDNIRTADLGGVSTAPVADTVPAQARTYRHPTLSDRQIVRLVREPLAEVEDLSLAVLGLHHTASAPVGHIRTRAVGFPAWPILTDPANARHALNLVGDLQQANHLARSRPGTAKRMLDELAAGLSASAPHFLPTFLEEAARIFLAHDNRTYATQYFTRAREAERTHNIPIDEERHHHALLEFALAGALSAQELTAESKSLLQRLNPTDALERFIQLNIDRVRGGLPPHAGLATDIKRLVKAAEANQQEIDERVLNALLPTASIGNAPRAFWNSHLAALTSLARHNPALKDRLFTLTPDGVTTADWLPVLEASGVADELRAGDRDVLDWIQRFITKECRGRRDDFPAELSRFIRALPSQAGRTLELTLRYFDVKPELLDAALSLECRVQIHNPSTWSYDFRLWEWVCDDRRSDLSHLAASEYADTAARGLEDVIQSHLSIVLAHEGSRQLLHRWARTRLTADSTAADFALELERLAGLYSPRARTELAEELSKFEAFADPAELTAKAIRDTRGSTRMRPIRAEDVADLLTTLPDWSPEEPKKLPKPVIAAAERLLGTTDPALTVTVGWLALRINRQVQQLRQLQAASTVEADGTFSGWAPSKDAVAWVNDGRVYGRDDLRMLNAILAGQASAKIHSGRIGQLQLMHPELFLAGVCRPFASRELIEGAAAALGAVRDSGLHRPESVLFTFPQPASRDDTLDVGDVVETATGPGLVIGFEEPDLTLFAVCLSPGGAIPAEVDGFVTAPHSRSSAVNLDDHVAAFTILLEDGAPPWDPTAPERFAEATGWPLPAAKIFLAGMPNMESWDHNWLPKQVREFLGLKVAEAAAAKDFLQDLGTTVLVDLLSTGVADPMRVARGGLGVDAMIARWQEHHTASVTLPEAIITEAERSFPYGGGSGVRQLTVNDADLTLTTHWLWLATQLPLQDPLRPWLADRLDHMISTSQRAEYSQMVGTASPDRNRIRAILGLPGFEQAPAGTIAHVGPWCITHCDDHDDIVFDPNLVENWDLELDRARAMPKGFSEAADIADLAAVAAGHFAPIQDWLRTPGDGWPQDPLASTPEILTDVQQTLDLSEDSARYWLQLLTLHNPTDKNIHHWNNWKKTQRLKAAEPLIEKGLLVEAKRPRAGRTLFLPGGSLEAKAPHLPLETWKAPLYHLENTPKVKPPFEIVLPLIPLPQLFTDAWRRHRDGDTPPPRPPGRRTLMNAEALSRCITLAVERIEGGAPPPAKLAADVKRLAKAAGVDFLEAAQPLVASALHAAVIKQAPQAFWNGFRAPIVAWARTSREARDALFALTPDIPTTRWLPLLEATGVADEMRAGERDVLDWIRRFIHKESDRWRQHFPAELSAFIRALPSQHGQTLRLDVARDNVEMELVDAALSLGLSVTFTGDSDPFGWLSWQFWLEDERRGDLVHVAASEHATHAAAGLDRITLGTHLDALLAHPGSTQLLHRWAAPRVDHGCTAADFLAEVDRLRPLCLPAYRDEFRDELAGLASVADPAELTAQVLRDGLLTELTWPALEEAARQLDEAHPDKVTIHESWPWFGVASGNRIIWVTADTSEAPVTVTPPVHSHHDNWQWFRVGGDTLCLSWTPEQGAHMTWASSPNTHHDLPHLLGGDPRKNISFETASGRLPGPGLIRPGDSRLRPRHRELLLQEGDALWCAEYSQDMRTLDPGTGKLGPESLPPRLASLIEDDLREGFTFIRASVEHWMNVVPGTEDSLLGVKDGQHGWVTLRRYPVLRCRGIDGTIWEHEATVWDHWIAPSSRIRRPGGGHWLVTLTGQLTRESCRRLLPASSLNGDDHLLHRLPVAGWHFLRPRDEAVSARMRAMTARDVQPLLDSLPAWTPEEPRQLPVTVVRAAQRLLATSDPALTVAVGWAALRTNRAVQRLRQLIENAPLAETEGEATWTPSLEAVPWAREGPWDQVLTRVTADELRERLASNSGSPLRMATLATLPLLAPELHLVGAARPLASRATIQAAAAAAAVIRDSGLVGPDTVLFTVPSPLILLSEPGSVTTTPTGPAVNIGICRDDDGTRLQLFLSPGGGVPTEIQGKPATVWQRSSGIDLADLAAAFDVVLSRGGPPWDPAAAERFALGSGWSRPAAKVFLAGSPLNKEEKLDWLPRDLRRLLGLTVAEAAAAREFLTGLDPALLASLYSAGAADPMRAIRHGLDVDAMLTRWQQLSQGLVMLPGDVLLSCRRELGPWQTDNLKLLPRPCADLLHLPHWLWLASSLKLDDPLRPWLAERLDDLTQASRAAPLRTSLIGQERGPVRACLGLPSVRDSIPGAEVRTGPWTVTRTDDGYDVLWFDPAETADWQQEHERALAVSRAADSDDLQHIANLAAVVSGRFTAIQDWLRTPGDGWPQDPLASAPDLVADVQQTLDLSEDSARYWLQLLTLHNPTDKNIHRWNGWTKTQRLKAAEPLIEKGLVIEATRPRAGRTLFLPGDWLQARSPHLPLETWKACLYHLEDTAKVKPPFEVVLPLIPLPQLFTDAWRRYREGHIPGHDDQTTERHHTR